MVGACTLTWGGCTYNQFESKVQQCARVTVTTPPQCSLCTVHTVHLVHLWSTLCTLGILCAHYAHCAPMITLCTLCTLQAHCAYCAHYAHCAPLSILCTLCTLCTSEHTVHIHCAHFIPRKLSVHRCAQSKTHLYPCSQQGSGTRI